MARLALLFVLATPLACARPPVGELPDEDPQLALRLVRDEHAVVLDVRSAEEFAAGHVDGALQIPHDELVSRLHEITAATGGDKQRPIVVYCRSGRRADLAKRILVGAGWSRVTNLGGYADWPGD
jgi:phage shock protein E